MLPVLLLLLEAFFIDFHLDKIFQLLDETLFSLHQPYQAILYLNSLIEYTYRSVFYWFLIDPQLIVLIVGYTLCPLDKKYQYLNTSFLDVLMLHFSIDRQMLTHF